MRVAVLLILFAAISNNIRQKVLITVSEKSQHHQTNSFSISSIRLEIHSIFYTKTFGNYAYILRLRIFVGYFENLCMYK